MIRRSVVNTIVFASALLLDVAVFAQPAPVARVYHDADTLEIDQKTGNITASGKALFLISGIFISAEKIVYLRDKELATAEGNVRIIRNNEEIYASRLTMDLRTNEMRLLDVYFVTDPKLSVTPTLDREILKISPEELAFEASRAQREQDLVAELKTLREQFVALRNLQRIKRNRGNEVDEELKRVRARYTQVLERLSRTKLQPNLVLSSLPDETRQRLQQRRSDLREVLKSNPELSNRLSGTTKVPGYLRVTASSMYQNKEGNYELEGTTLTSCRCEPEGRPAFGFSARTALVEPNQYATMTGTTLDVAGVPTMYTPWLKFPIKTKRETGLLLPSIYASRSGDTFSQPLFITHGDHADSTVTVNSFQSRGIRVDVETRYQMSPESQIRLYGEGLRDKQYEREGQLERVKMENDVRRINEDPKKSDEEKVLEEQDRRDLLGSTKTGRWYTQGSWNVPIQSVASAKADVEFVSDNRYLGDFSKDTTVSQDIFTPSLSARRFLTQDAAAEFYGSDVMLSARFQGVRDLFAVRTSDTPMRLPRVEFYLLPKRYFDLPFVFDQTIHWEHVERVNGTSFKDMRSAGRVVDVSANSPSDANKGGVDPSPSPTNFARNSRKDPFEPFLEGDRTFTQSRITWPVTANDYINASVGVKGTSIQYHFPPTHPFPEQNPYETFVTYEAGADMPLYSKLALRGSHGSQYGFVRHDFVPRVGFSYIPNVAKSPTFPFPSQSFYEADNVNSQQVIGFGFHSAWTISKNVYEESAKELPRIPAANDVGVANETVFMSVLEEKRIDLEKSPDKIFEFSASQAAPAVYQRWAQRELEIYESQVLASEFGDPLVWPSPTAFVHRNQWEIRPFSLDVSTSYNLMQKKTDAEATARNKPDLPPVERDPLADVLIRATANTEPFFPLTANVFGSWRRKWSKWKTAGYTITAGLGYGFSASYGNSFVMDESRGQKDLRLDRLQQYMVEYTPPRWNWITARYQRELDIKRSVGRPTNPEFEYRAMQSISFNGIQDCMNIVLQRTKLIEHRERDAIWAIGLNVQFASQARALPPVQRTWQEMNNFYSREIGQ